MSEAPDDDEVVTRLIGRRPMGAFRVVVRRVDGSPVVLENEPLLASGRPMPTRFWLADRALNKAIGQLESTGGVKQAEAEIGLAAIRVVHDAYEAERDAVLPADHDGPRPSAGVGGTRQGVKCLHAHYAHFLAGGADPVGEWVHRRLAEVGKAYDPAEPGIVSTWDDAANSDDANSDDAAPNDRRDAPVNPTVAAIDLGTITTRLLVVGPGTEHRVEPITRMGAEVDRTGHLGSAALERVRVALASHRVDLDTRGAERVRVVATAAARVAEDRADLAALVEETIGVELEVLDGSTEGRLTFAGACGGLDIDPSDLVVVFDIGGGSTEWSFGNRSDGLLGVHSADIGAARVTDTYFEHDPPSAAELSAALSVIQLHLDDAVRELRSLPAAIDSGTVVGVGGTITTVAAVELGLLSHDPASLEGFVLTRDAAEDVFRTLATESRRDRAFNPGLPADRVDLIVGGCCVLVEAMRHLGIEQVRVSRHDLLDGVVAELLLSSGGH